MSTITKERAQEIFLGNGPEPTASEERELARIAMASLEAKPVAAAYVINGVIEADDFASYCGHPKFQDGPIELYANSPAPVSVPEDVSGPLAHAYKELTPAFMRNHIDVFERYGIYPDGLAGIQAMRIALDGMNRRAAMLQGADTELQRKASIHDALCEKYNVESLADFVDWQRNHIAELEAAPPAPVNKGETAVMPDYPGYVMTQRECFEAGKKARLTEAGDSPVIPDGWVDCSERMPDPESKFRVCAYTPTPHEDVRFRFVPASLFKSVCRDATHWKYMLPPAAPQQEAE